jgi:hypothetical protein
MNTQHVRIPVPAPVGAATRSTDDAAKLLTTSERAAAYARAQEAHAGYIAAAAGDQEASALAVVDQDQRTRAMLAHAHTATGEGVTRFATTAAVASVVTVGSYAVFGPLGGVIAALGGVVVVKLFGGGR